MNYIEEYINDKTTARPLHVYNVYNDILNNTEYHYDDKKADKVINFIQKFCKHSKGEFAGRNFILLPFQKAFISALFGMVDDEGNRRFNEAFLYMARKNGKTELLSAIALYCLIAEKGAEVYSLATKYAQARLCFDEAVNMVRQSPALSAGLKKRKSDLYYEKGMSKYQPLSKNASTLDGLNSSLTIIDECHAIRGRELYDVLKQSQSARKQPLTITITTAGIERESIFDDLYKYAVAVASGMIKDTHFLPLLYELDKGDSYEDESVWVKCNPGIDTIKSRQDVRDKLSRARHIASELPSFLCKDFNIISNANKAWLNYYDVHNENIFCLDDFKGRYAIGGVDLSLTTDFTAACILLAKGGNYFVYPHFWLPKTKFEELRQGNIPYEIWHKNGLLSICNGDFINPSDIAEWFAELYKIRKITPIYIYYDSYSARYFVEDMTARGFNMVKCIQGARTLSQPFQRLETDLKAKRINYNNNPILEWCLLNTNVDVDRNGNVLPVKRAYRSKYKNDGLSALLNCYVGLTEHYKEIDNESVSIQQ